MKTSYKVISILVLLAITFSFGYYRGARPTIESDADAYYRVHALFKEACEAEGGTLLIDATTGKPGCQAK